MEMEIHITTLFLAASYSKNILLGPAAPTMVQIVQCDELQCSHELCFSVRKVILQNMVLANSNPKIKPTLVGFPSSERYILADKCISDRDS